MSVLLTTVERLRKQAANRPREEKEQRGQFLTPSGVAQLVTSLFRPLTSSSSIRLLDPGAGIGSLTAAFVHWLVQQEYRPESVEIVAVELDDNLLPLLRETLESCETTAQHAGLSLRARVVHADFLKLCDEEAELFTATGVLKPFTHAILNPPYRKINTNSFERELLRKRGIEVSNIYAGFVALATLLLAEGGELSAITPRSFCNGTYFKHFRQKLFSSMSLQAAHVFASRQKAFSQDAVLQENVIFSARKDKERPMFVSIRASDGPESASTENLVPYATVLPPYDRDMVIHLPANETGMQAMEFVTSLPAQLEKLGIKVSTGPVVDFRAREFLLEEMNERSVPLLYPSNLSRLGVDWPKPGRKPQAIVVSPETTWSLMPIGNYVLTKRFTSKEEKKRIVARVLEGEQFPEGTLVGLENHLNYFHANGHGLDGDLAFGLAAYLNSTVVDVYFRQFNGHTQVNAGDLRMMRYPDAAVLRQLGRAALENRVGMYEQTKTDMLVGRIIQMSSPKIALTGQTESTCRSSLQDSYLALAAQPHLSSFDTPS
jgi:adenine-specific DNA-methyltransferase